ncbi:MAG: hypothetical protein OWQ48_00310 [Desulfurococcus sp.]|nr:hypothetical protein [Desulfurococcus sp.]
MVSALTSIVEPSALASCVKNASCSREVVEWFKGGFSQSYSSRVFQDAVRSLCSIKPLVGLEEYAGFIKRVTLGVDARRVIGELELMISSSIEGDPSLASCGIVVLESLAEAGFHEGVYTALSRLVVKMLSGKPDSRVTDFLKDVVRGPLQALPPVFSSRILRVLANARGAGWLPVKVEAIKELSLNEDSGSLLHAEFTEALLNLFNSALDELPALSLDEAASYYAELATAFTHLYKKCLSAHPLDYCSSILSRVSERLAAIGGRLNIIVYFDSPG